MTDSFESMMKQGTQDDQAVALGEGIFMSRGIANSYLVTTADGNVMINASLTHEAQKTKARFAAVSSAPLRYIIFTQGHPDHVDGWVQFSGLGVETIAQADHPNVREYWRALHPFYFRRIRKIWGAVSDVRQLPPLQPPPVLTTRFIDTQQFDLGGRRFELFAAPEGETTDGLIVWLPQTRTVFIGNLMGPMFGHVPNLYTIRGDKIRSARRFINSVQRVIDLAPDVLINGHDAFRGAHSILMTLTKVRDAVRYLRDAVIEGMNAGKTLWTLMQEIQLPDALAIPQVHGKVSWIVRTIWEEHAGWFRFDSTTELYEVPPAAVHTDILELAGSAALVDRARAHCDEKRPLHALHLTDIVLTRTPADPAALQVKRSALQQLVERSGGENYSEMQWLKAEIASADALLGD
jgi:glyoxylase-like metal-dependent hydrolase (beta-lactamase superfamily II)